MKKIEIIDFLRGYSIFTIVVMHLCQRYADGALDKALSLGGAGVHVFILCSGFGLYLSYLKRPLGYWDFLKRRFSKVWIPYAIAVVLWLSLLKYCIVYQISRLLGGVFPSQKGQPCPPDL